MSTSPQALLHFLDRGHKACRLLALMKRKLTIKVAFEPTRLADEPLKRAYELLVPIERRIMGEQLIKEGSDPQSAVPDNSPTSRRKA